MNDQTVVNDGLPPRRFVPNEEAVYQALQKHDAELVCISWLVNNRIIGGNIIYGEQLEFLGIPYEKMTGRTHLSWYMIRKEALLTALGRTPFVRPALIAGRLFAGQSGMSWVKARNIPIVSEKGCIWISRENALRYADSLKRKEAPAPAPSPAAQVPMPLTPDWGDLLDRLDELKIQQEKVNAAQAILFKEVQLVRKGLSVSFRQPCVTRYGFLE